MKEVRTLGIVKGGKYFHWDNTSDPVVITQTGVVEGTAPSPMKLDEYEGKVIMIIGQAEQKGLAKIIYDAKIVDVANPILSVITMKLFDLLQNGLHPRDHRLE